jgi:hypothetical protein
MQHRKMTWMAFGAVLGASLYSLMDASVSAQPRNPLERWDYHTFETSNNLESHLDGFGGQGWELVAASPKERGGPGNTLFVLIRPVQ